MSTDDPTLPGYRPPYEGDPGGLDVGSGGSFGASLYALYECGRVTLPDVVAVYVGAAESVHVVRGEWDAADGVAHSVTPTIRSRLEIILDALTTTAINTRKAGDALIEIADRYVRTDEAAQGRFDKLLQKNDSLYDDPLVPPPAPPTSQTAPPGELGPDGRPLHLRP